MIETDIQTRINGALNGRRSQRPFVDQLTAGWAAMVDGLDRLVELLHGADRSVRQNLATPDGARVAATIDALLRSGPLAGIRGRIDETGRQIDAAAARVRRDTVNIGVIGGTKVGKSTLLRTITKLPDTVVPSTRFNPTTAAASSIYHTDGAPSATLLLHTWESFREEYLAALHEMAGLDPVPADIEGFRRFRYPAAGSAEAAGAKADDYLRKLQTAQRSLDSYERLLLGRERTATVEFAALRPYVAYPRKEENDPDDVQPYHAVRSIRIEQPFLDGVATRLGLIDLPGAGEAGLDIDRQFLRQVKNEIDLLLMVKRGDRKGASYLAEDSYTRNLADSARGGVPLDDYYVVVVNRDRANDLDGAFFANTVKSVREVSGERNIRVLAADVADREEVLTGLLEPVLRHLATRLAEMDRAVVREALTLVAAVAEDIAGYADEVLRRVREAIHLLPDQEDEFRTLAEKLRNALAVDLSELVDRYDANLVSGDCDAALTAAVAEAVGEARSWVRGGLGHGDRDAWMEEIRGPYLHGSLEAKQDEYYRAKTEITTIFSRIDPSLNESVQRLWDEVAEVLRGRLTSELVPAGPGALEQLRATAGARRALILAGALDRLCDLKEDYGSVVLRVTQPIIRGIHWERAGTVSAPAVGSYTRAPLAPQTVPAQQTPAPSVAPPVRGSRWVVEPDGTRRRISGVVVPAPIGEQQAAKLGAEGLYEELTLVVESCVTELEIALRAEARLMTRTLAAAADRFFDSAIRTNRSERDYEYLCRPNLRSIWPDRFDGGTGRLVADLTVLEEQARSAVELASLVTNLSAGLRLSAAGN